MVVTHLSQCLFFLLHLSRHSASFLGPSNSPIPSFLTLQKDIWPPPDGFAKSLRLHLWAEHLGLLEKDGSAKMKVDSRANCSMLVLEMAFRNIEMVHAITDTSVCSSL